MDYGVYWYLIWFDLIWKILEIICNERADFPISFLYLDVFYISEQ